ncbi:FAD-binding protein [Chloroflexota bacterium]
MAKDIIETDVLIIGAGIAGCRAAIEAHDRGASVTLTTKGLLAKDAGATWMAHKGYQCWGIYPHDTLDVHVEDTLRCGWFLNNQENVYAFLAHVPDTAMELLRWGVRYKMKNGKFNPVWQLGCSTKEGRSIYTETDPRGKLGYHYSRIFPRLVKARKINIIEDMFIIDLLNTGDSIVGAVGIDVRTGEFKVFRAKATILATGGYQGLYKVTSANPNLTGDGQGMALRAGVDMMDFEFIQTLPGALWPPQMHGSLLPFSLLIDWDAHMYNSENERFLAKWDPVKMERSTRAILSRAIFHEIKEGRASPHGGIYTSVTHKPKSFIEGKLRENERNVDFIKLRQAGIDLYKDGVETGYVVHYCQGGCNVNSGCETDKSGLYAIGEGASGSKDGADRMMANALPYCMAMGIIAGREAAQMAKMVQVSLVSEAQVERLLARALAPLERQGGVRVYEVKPWLQDVMVKETGYGRSEEGLKAALNEIKRYKEEVIPRLWVSNKSKKVNLEWVNALEFENLVLVGECIIRNALLRAESRGLHERWEHTAPDPNWFKNIHLRLVDGELQQWTTPVEFTYWQPEPGSLGKPWHRGVKVKEYRGWRAQPLYERM